MSASYYRHTDSGMVFALPMRGTRTVAGQAVGPHTSPEALADMGCTPYTPEPTSEDAAEPVAAVSYYSKLLVVRALQSAGLWASFSAWLGDNPDIEAQWQAAQHIASDDPVFLPAIEGFCAASGLSDEDAAALLEECTIR